MKYDIVSIGDTTIDAFIELHEASVHCSIDHTDCKLELSYADKIPYEKLAMMPAGNSTNNAVGSARLGLKNAFITSIGNDNQGKQIISELSKEGVDAGFIHIDKNSQTNFHFVLSFQAERTILIKHNKFVYKLPKNLDTEWMYFSSMAAGTEKFHKEFERFLNKHSKIKLAFNPGTFQMRMGVSKLRGIYKRTEILFLNKEEAQLVLKMQTRNIKTLLAGMHKIGAKIAVITDGRQGSYASNGSGKVWYLDEFPGAKIEATGAGDAYGTAFTAAISYGKSLAEAMAWGTVNAGHVVMFVGPHKGLQTKEQIEHYLKSHSRFRAKEI
ncbi:MAG: carbohydrate kinase family protein [Candidatus Doudnabacteria bacterium]|nr:carbohydrate kinase family protein [Candidatus Doudnabacteria bacterium]